MTPELWTDPRFPGVAARRAGRADLPALLALRSRLAEDYLPEVLADWLSDAPGGVYAYFCDGELCGLASIHVPRPGQAWLRGKRIAEGFEGRGIGRATAVFEIEEAARLGARVVRLMTAVDNAPVHRIMERVGMAPVGRWRVAWDAAAGAAAGGAADSPTPGVPPDAAATVPARPVGAPLTPVPLAPGDPGLDAAAALLCGPGDRGLIGEVEDPYTLFALDPAEVEALAREGSLAAVAAGAAGEEGRHSAVAVLTAADRVLLLRRLAGETAAAAALAAWAGARARERGLRLCVSLPEDEMTPALAALGAPADAGEAFVVYERRLEGEGAATP